MTRRSEHAGGAVAGGSGTLLGLVLLLTRAAAGAAQEPPDTLRPDTLPAPPDTVQVADSASADTIFHNLPALEGEAPDGWATGVWSWDHRAIMASGANTVAELVAEVPGLLTLMGGDYGTPVTLSAFGGGGGGLRVIRDGFEVLPLAGGVVDLGRLGLVGISRVRLDRSAGGLLLELWSHAYEDGRPYSLIEAGTGELDTNFFRGIYSDPTALGGSIAGGLERNDTRGPRADEPGSRTGTWVRYQLHHGDGLGVGFETRSVSTESEVEQFAASVSRRDWVIRARGRLAEGLTAELYTGKSIHDVEDERPSYLHEGGERAQQGVRLAFARSGAYARAELRTFGGDRLPSDRADGWAGYADPRLGGVEAGLERAAWPDREATSVRVRGWTGPLLGLSAFGSFESGTRGSRLGPPMTFPDTLGVNADTLPRPFAMTERTALRVGAGFEWRRVAVSAAALRVEADSLIPLSLALDRGAPLLPGGTHNGFEVWGRLPTLWESLRLEGSLQQWGEAGPYLPEQIYRGALVFHRQYRENLELWWSVGVRGRDPMQIHVLDDDPAAEPGALLTMPFFQSWYGRIQLRIVTMRLYIVWENLTVRRNLQDFPDRVLPHTRAVYGLRWTLWN